MIRLLLFFNIALLAGCTKEKGEKDDQPPVISISSPTNNQVFTGGQTIAINATASDNTKIEELHLNIINSTTNTFYTHEHYAPNAPTYTLSRTITVQGATTYKIIIEANDPTGNHGEQGIRISAN